MVLIHSDIDIPFAKQDNEPVYLSQMKALLRRHRNASIIWAHVGLGRVVHPVQVSAQAAERHPGHVAIVEAMLTDPELAHVNFDISWDEVAKSAISSPEAIAWRPCSTAIPIGSCSAPTRWRLLDPGRISRCSTCGIPSGAN